MFINESSIAGSWQSFERLICRLLLHLGFRGVRLVGQSRDQGADVIASGHGKRWLFQVKHWRKPIGVGVLDATVRAMSFYRAEVPAIVSLSGFDEECMRHQARLHDRDIRMQLYDANWLLRQGKRLGDQYPFGDPSVVFDKRKYQEEAIQIVIDTYLQGVSNRALVVMATGLGKTFVAAESIRRLNVARSARPLSVLVLAHTNEIVYQLERTFWPHLRSSQETLVWNGYEQQTKDDLCRSSFVFACINTVSEHLRSGGDLPEFDIIMVDECHHAGAEMYSRLISHTRAGQAGGPFLLGLTATPWRGDDADLRVQFGDPVIAIDLVMGLRNGYLSNVDYRIFTDNIDWAMIAQLNGSLFTPKKINRTLFINQWDDGVVQQLRSVWKNIASPKAIVFCGTVDHAIIMRDRINAFGFCNAGAVYSRTQAGAVMEPHDRNRLLCDFQDGVINVICVVDLFNEGIDVPDANIIVFQRVTHSRRIFIQQLGRGLRISAGKQKVVVLDFVSDIRRFAAGLELKDALDDSNGPKLGRPVRINLPNRVTFYRADAEDSESESFLRQWLDDIAAVANAEEETAILRYPPILPGSRQ